MKVFNTQINYSWIKENIAMLVLIPTVLGGLWQMIQLLQLGTPFVRFFSVSQLVADGLLILFLLSLCILGGYLVTLTSKRLFRNLFWSNESTSGNNTGADTPFFFKEPTINRQQKQFRIFFFLVFILSFGFMFIQNGWSDQFSPIAPGKRIKPANIIALFMNVCFVAIFLEGIVASLLTILGRKVNYQNNYFQKVRAIIPAVAFIAVIVSLIYLLPILRDSFLVPEGFKNIDNLHAQVRKNNPELKSWKMAYFNDKFIFLEVVDSSGRKYVEVMEFNALFSVDNQK